MNANVSNRDSRPNPDPTVLTTEQLIREINALKTLQDTRMDGIDNLVEMLQRSQATRANEVTKEVTHLQTLHDEKFQSIQKQFVERDTRTEQTQKDSKVAVDAALQAAKEAVGEQNKSSALAIAKSEAATTKQIDTIGSQIGAMRDNLDDKINDVKTRLAAIESKSAGRTEASSDSRGMILLVISVIMAGIGIFTFIGGRSSSSDKNSSDSFRAVPTVPATPTPSSGSSPQVIVVPMPSNGSTPSK